MHPDKVAQGPNEAKRAQYNFIYAEICEAYEVLSDSTLRDIYDKYGENTLKNGVPDGRGGYKGGYTFSGDLEGIFYAFFGTRNPQSVCLDLEDNSNLRI